MPTDPKLGNGAALIVTVPPDLAAARGLLQALGDRTYVLDREFRFVACDEAAAAYLGQPAGDLLGRTIWEAFPSTAEPPLGPLLRRAMADRRPERIEMAGSLHPDRWLECTLFPIEDGLGVAFRDHTAAHRATEVLMANEERLRDLLATLDLGNSMARDLDGTIRFWSEGCARLYGWTAAEALGRSAHELLGTRFPVPMAQVAAALEATGEWIGDLRQVARDGRSLVVAARKVLRRDPTGRPVAVLEAVSDVTAQRAAEAALAESEARLALATAAAEIGIWDWALPEDRLVCSPHLLALCGLDPAGEVTPALARRLIHPCDLRRVAGALGLACDPARRTHIDLACRIRRSDGAIRQVVIQGEPVFAERGGMPTVVRLVGTLRDVTERWQFQEERLANEARLRLALGAGRMAIWDADLRTGDVSGSPELARLLGFPDGTLPDLPAIRARFAPGESDRLRLAGHAVLASGEQFLEAEFRYIRPDEVERWLLLRTEFILGEAGRPVRATGVVLDITERRQIEEALRESEGRLRFAFAAAGLTSWEVDLGTGMARRSAMAPQAAPETEEAVLADLLGRIHPEDRGLVEAQLAAIAERRIEDFTVEYRRRAAGQEGWLWAETHGAVAGREPETGRPLRIAGVTRDITERKQAEERQTLLAREVDHRAKNALAVVQAALRLTPKDDPVGYMRAVEGRVAALARAQTLLARGRWVGAELRALLEDELAPFLAEGAGAPRVRLEGPPVLLWPAATQALSMAMHELATNAVKHGALGRPGGMVTVRWQVEGEERLVLHLAWLESGGPSVPAGPSRRGFGTRVLDGTVRAQLGGKVRQSWSAGGIAVEMEVPLLGGHPAPMPADVSASLQ